MLARAAEVVREVVLNPASRGGCGGGEGWDVDVVVFLALPGYTPPRGGDPRECGKGSKGARAQHSLFEEHGFLVYIS